MVTAKPRSLRSTPAASPAKPPPMMITLFDTVSPRRSLLLPEPSPGPDPQGDLQALGLGDRDAVAKHVELHIANLFEQLMVDCPHNLGGHHRAAVRFRQG